MLVKTLPKTLKFIHYYFLAVRGCISIVSPPPPLNLATPLIGIF